MLGTCIGCRKEFRFNPHRVPSIVVDGVRMEICLDCATKANEARKTQGYETFEIHPDSYEA